MVRKRKQARLYHHSSTLKIVKAQNREREPWLLASSLRSDQVTPKQVVAYYRTRMQIEEAFRDTKSVRYGFCLRHCNTTRIQRLKILLLIAALAHYCALLLGLAIQKMKQAYRFQANTNSRRAVLSIFFLGCLVMRHPQTMPSVKVVREAVKILRERINLHQACM